MGQRALLRLSVNRGNHRFWLEKVATLLRFVLSSYMVYTDEPSNLRRHDSGATTRHSRWLVAALLRVQFFGSGNSVTLKDFRRVL